MNYMYFNITVDGVWSTLTFYDTFIIIQSFLKCSVFLMSAYHSTSEPGTGSSSLNGCVVQSPCH